MQYEKLLVKNIKIQKANITAATGHVACAMLRAVVTQRRVWGFGLQTFPQSIFFQNNSYSPVPYKAS